MEVQRIPKRTVSVIEPQKSILVDKEKYHQKRVAAYCRVSTDSEEQLTSYQNQMRVYTEMIAANKEWEFAGLYADEGISGTRADKRPEFQRMIRDCQNGKIDYIITKSVSRFARNTQSFHSAFLISFWLVSNANAPLFSSSCAITSPMGDFMELESPVSRSASVR